MKNSHTLYYKERLEVTERAEYAQKYIYIIFMSRQLNFHFVVMDTGTGQVYYWRGLMFSDFEFQGLTRKIIAIFIKPSVFKKKRKKCKQWICKN